MAEKKYRTLTIELPSATIEYLKNQASLKGISIDQLVENLLRNMLAELGENRYF